MKSIKFSFFVGFLAIIIYALMDVVGTFLALVTGIVNMPSYSLNPFLGGMEYLTIVADRNYYISFIIGFFLGFPLFILKSKIDSWVKVNSK